MVKQRVTVGEPVDEIEKADANWQTPAEIKLIKAKTEAKDASVRRFIAVAMTFVVVLIMIAGLVMGLLNGDNPFSNRIVAIFIGLIAIMLVGFAINKVDLIPEILKALPKLFGKSEERDEPDDK